VFLTVLVPASAPELVRDTPKVFAKEEEIQTPDSLSPEAGPRRPQQ